jgi:hypothetical protein
MRAHAPTHLGFNLVDIERFPTVRVLLQCRHAKRHTPMPCRSDWGRQPNPSCGAAGGVGGCGTWLGAVGLGSCGGDSTRVGAQGHMSGGSTPVLGTSARVGLQQPVTSRASPVYRGEHGWVSALDTDGRSLKNPRCMRGRRLACAVTAYLRVGTVGRIACARFAGKRSTGSRRAKTITPCTPPGDGRETRMTGEEGGYTQPV